MTETIEQTLRRQLEISMHNSQVLIEQNKQLQDAFVEARAVITEIAKLPETRLDEVNGIIKDYYELIDEEMP